MAQGDPLDPADLASLLDWYRAGGVDAAMGEEPVDRFALARAPVAGGGGSAPAQPAPAARPLPESAMAADPAEARALAKEARTLEELRAILDAYEGCALKFRATQLVFADGNPEAKVMLIGEAPGAEEDRTGRPFVGRSGQLLDRMLAAIGLDRTGVYIANTVPWRPPGNRNPTPEEMALCLPFLHRQVELVAPSIVVTLGGPATQTIFGTKEGILKTRGRWREVGIGTHVAQGLATLHPAYLLRTPSAKALAWKDMLSLREKMDALGLGTGPG